MAARTAPARPSDARRRSRICDAGRGPEALGHAWCGRDEHGRSGKRMRGTRENPDGLLEPAPHLELEVARTHILRGAGSHESVAGVEALRVRIPIRHPQEHLDVV